MRTVNKLFLVSLSTAISILMIFGISTAFGEPTKNPPATDLSPTFGGVSIKDSLNNEVFGVVTDDNGIAPNIVIGRATGVDNVKISGPVQFIASTIDNLLGTTNLGTTTIGSVGLPKNLTVNGTLTATGDLTANTGTAKFLDITLRNLTTSASVTTNGSVNLMQGATVGSSTTPKNLTVNGNLTTTGTSTTGTSTLGETTIGTTSVNKKLTVNGDLTSTGLLSSLGNLNVSGISMFNGPVSLNGLSAFTNLNVYGNSQLGNNDGSNSVDIYGTTTISGDLTATNIGKFEYITTKMTNAPASSTYTNTLSCGAGKKMTACSVQADATARYGLEVNGTKIDSNGMCYVWVTNKTASALLVWMSITCFDPTTN